MGKTEEPWPWFPAFFWFPFSSVWDPIRPSRKPVGNHELPRGRESARGFCGYQAVPKAWEVGNRVPIDAPFSGLGGIFGLGEKRRGRLPSFASKIGCRTPEPDSSQGISIAGPLSGHNLRLLATLGPEELRGARGLIDHATVPSRRLGPCMWVVPPAVRLPRVLGG
jgi:hypothetical protein